MNHISHVDKMYVRTMQDKLPQKIRAVGSFECSLDKTDSQAYSEAL